MRMPTYRSRRRVGLCRGLLTLGLVSACWAQEVPFQEGFDDLDTGVLDGQNDWHAYRRNDMRVQTGTVQAGTKAGTLTTNATVWREFSDETATDVWIDFYARCPRPTDSTPPVLTNSVAAAFYVDENGGIRAVSNEAWVVLDYTVPTNEWRRFSVHLDYAAQQWELHVADATPNAMATPLATNLAFSSLSTNTYFRVFRIRN